MNPYNRLLVKNPKRNAKRETPNRRSLDPVVLLARNQFGLWLKEPLPMRLASEPERSKRRMKNRLMVAYAAGFTAGWAIAKSK